MEKERRGGCFRKIVIGALLATVLLVAVVIGAWVMAPGIVRSQIEEKGSAALGVPVKVGGVSLSLFGSASVSDLTIAAPPGYSQATLFSVKKAGGSVDVFALLGGTLRVTSVTVDVPRVVLETNAEGGRSLQSLLDGIKKQQEAATAAASAAPPAEPPAKDPAAPPLPFDVELDGVKVTDSEVLFVDAYATPGTPMEGALKVGSVALDGVRVTKELKGRPGVTPRLRVGDFSVENDATYTNPKLLAFEDLAVELDLVALLDSLPAATRVVTIPSIEQSGLRLHAESASSKEESSLPENVMDFQLVATNATVLAEPAKRRAEVLAAARAAAQSSGSTSAPAASSTATATPAASSGTEAPAPPPVALLVKSLKVNAPEITQLFRDDASSKRTLWNTEVLGRDLEFPATGRISQFSVGTSALDQESRVFINAEGELLRTPPDLAMAVIVDVKNQQLAGVGDVTSGRLFASLSPLRFADRRVTGTAKVRLKNFDMKAPQATQAGDLTGLISGAGQTVAVQSLKVLSQGEGTEVTVPISYSLESGNWSEAPRKFFLALFNGLAGGASSALAELHKLGGGLGDAGKAVDETLKSATPALQDAGGKLESGAKDAGKAVEGAVKDVGGAIEGLFGKKKKDDDEK